jgi:ribosomal protein S26
LRGKEVAVTCDSCGRKVPRNKAVAYEKGISFSTDLHNVNDVRFFEKRKVYYCISCAKHRGIFQKLKEQAERRNRRY